MNDANVMSPKLTVKLRDVITKRDRCDDGVTRVTDTHHLITHAMFISDTVLGYVV